MSSKVCEMAVKERTRKIYLDRVREYVEWCEFHNYRSNDPETITVFNDPETASIILVNIMIVTLRTSISPELMLLTSDSNVRNKTARQQLQI